MTRPGTQPCQCATMLGPSSLVQVCDGDEWFDDQASTTTKNEYEGAKDVGVHVT